MGNAWLLADDPICKFADARLPGLAQALEQTSGLISKDSFMLKEMLSWCQVKSRVITCGMPTPRVPILRLPICMAGLSELGPCWVSPPPKKKKAAQGARGSPEFGQKAHPSPPPLSHPCLETESKLRLETWKVWVLFWRVLDSFFGGSKGNQQNNPCCYTFPFGVP